ncbi:MAG: 5-oxoprolinase subunit PxpA [Hyphomicrobiaceae bacterium]
MATIDLNADLGEGFGAWRAGDDRAMLAIVTSANVACGLHAGDPDIMAETFRIAREKGVAVGAHPGFADLQGFGRRRIPLSAGEIERLVAYQIGAAAALAAYAGHRLTYFKAHGALANMAAEDRSIADAVSRGARAADPSLVQLAIAASEQMKAAEAAGLRAVGEIFADRGYDARGQLVSRGLPGAMIEDADEAAGHVLRMVEEGAIVTGDGTRVAASFGSVCVHGDGPHALKVAARVRARLEEAGVPLAAFAP